jgi:hypothetical protein
MYMFSSIFSLNDLYYTSLPRVEHSRFMTCLGARILKWIGGLKLWDISPSNPLQYPFSQTIS